MKRLLLAGLVVAAALSGGLPAGGSPGAANGRIAYERHGFLGGAEVWTMSQHGADLQRLSSGRDPAWSPDGTRLVVVDAGRLVVVRADGGGARPLEVTGAPAHALVHPAWSPDGTVIAFGGSDGLYVVPAQGGAALRLSSGYEVAPAWSPDGTQIAFIGSNGAVNVVRPDGSGLRQLAGARGDSGRSVSWSPDGSTIAYGDSQTGGISTVRLDGMPPVALVPYLGVAQSADPAWSPDGKRIAFVDNGVDICVVDSDGTDLGRLTYAPYDELSGRSGAANINPAWQPLAAGGAPASTVAAPSGPSTDWERGLSWAWACSLQYGGRSLTAVVTPTRAKVGGIVTYRVRLGNRSDVPIGEVGLVAFAATLDGGARVLSIQSTQGRCSSMSLGGSDRPRVAIECQFGALFPGEAATVTVRVRAAAPGGLTLVGSLPQPLPAGDGTDASGLDLVKRTRIAGCTERGTEVPDVINGSARADVLCGLGGNDRIRALAGRDSVYAGAGEDMIVVRDRERDRVSCGSDEDTVVPDGVDLLDPDCEHVHR